MQLNVDKAENNLYYANRMSETGANDGPRQGPEPTGSPPRPDAPNAASGLAAETTTARPRRIGRLATAAAALSTLIAACTPGGQGHEGPSVHDSLRNPGGTQVDSQQSATTAPENRANPEIRRILNEQIAREAASVAGHIDLFGGYRGSNRITDITYKDGEKTYRLFSMDIPAGPSAGFEGSYFIMYEQELNGSDTKPNAANVSNVFVGSANPEGQPLSGASFAKDYEGNWQAVKHEVGKPPKIYSTTPNPSRNPDYPEVFPEVKEIRDLGQQALNDAQTAISASRNNPPK